MLFNETNVVRAFLLSSWVRFFASYTFTLYLFYVPVIKFILVATELDKADLLGRCCLVVYGFFVIVYFISNVVEHKKALFRGWAHFVIELFSQALQRIGRV
ncbi:hypothetical protein IV03_09965 [Pseudomonas congelans]|nr:hypothetical protein IV03_09965 [Pseudomonas congelans]